MGIVVDLVCPCTHSLARWFPNGTFAPTPWPWPWHDPTTVFIRLSLTCYPVTLFALLLLLKSCLVRARARRLQRLAHVAAVLDVSQHPLQPDHTPLAPTPPVPTTPTVAASATTATTAATVPPALLVCTKCHDARRAPPPSLNPDRKRTGELLYDALASPSHPTLSPLVAAGKLQILPVKCLANCDAANCIALASTDKFSYQFTGLCASDDVDLEDIASFAGYYATGRQCAGEDHVSVEDQVAFTKVKTRPRGLKNNCVARIPPLFGPGRDMLLGSAPRLPPAPIEDSQLEMATDVIRCDAAGNCKPVGEPEVAIALEPEPPLCVDPQPGPACRLPPTPPDSHQALTPVVHHRTRSTSVPRPCGGAATANPADDGFRLVRSRRRRRRARTPARNANAPVAGPTGSSAW